MPRSTAAGSRRGTAASKDTIDATEARLALAKDAVDKAQAALNHVRDKAPTDPVRAQAEANLQSAKDARDAIVRILSLVQGLSHRHRPIGARRAGPGRPGQRHPGRD